MYQYISLSLIILLFVGCTAPTEQLEIDPPEITVIDSVDGTAVVPDNNDEPPSWTTAWIMNETGATSPIFNGVQTDVTKLYLKTVDGVKYQCIQSSGIPSYATTIEQDHLDQLVQRPRATNDFSSGSPELSVGETVLFGTDIGYDPQQGCTEGNDGAGYWPPGPACPTNQEKDWCFPLDPEPIADGDSCSTGLNQIGVYVNGVSIFNWQDGQSYNNENVWVNNAFYFEIYDLDICVGHSAMGNYHHHSNPTCLGEQLEDDGTKASPIYGFSADGYPIYGPWETAGLLAQSCWVERDYENPNSETGCGTPGERSCLLVDQYDISKGTVAAARGPATNETLTSMSGNPIVASSGAYFQDYYYDSDCTDQGVEFLDEHNGHETEELGYHYHTTLILAEDGTFDYAFPHYNGPTYAGQLMDNAIAQCSDGMGGGPPPGNGPPGQQDGGNGPAGNRQPPDLAAAAQILGISEDTLRDALGVPPPDFQATADKLGITLEELQSALGVDAP